MIIARFVHVLKLKSNLGQTSIYDNAYIPLGVISPVTINYKTSFALDNTVRHSAFVISGF